MNKKLKIEDIAEHIPEEEDVIDFQKEFWEVGLAAEKGLTVDDVDPDQLAKGIEVEMEHTTNEAIAQKIALDHLAELDDYYTQLEKMEGEHNEL